MLGALLLCLHPLSISSSRIEVDGARVHVSIHAQAASWIEALPAIDRDHDGALSQPELDAARDAIAARVLDEYVLADAANGAVLGGRLVELRPADDVVKAELGRQPLVDVALEYTLTRPLGALRITSRLFHDTSPLHRDHCELVWNGGAPQSRVLWVEDDAWTVQPTSSGASGTFGAYVRLGIEHILTGFDHLAFLVALVVGARSLRSILVVITAFTAAHSTTLALAALDVVRVSPSIVEPAIAASIVWVALRNLWTSSRRSAWPEAFVFGLVHGLGFAGSVADVLAAESRKLLALVGFNAGVELGQLAAVLALGLVVAAWKLARRDAETSTARTGFAPRLVRIAASICVALAGAFWLVERIAAA